MLNSYVTLNAQGQQQLNASFVQGDTFALAFSGSTGGTPINLTGAVIKMTIQAENDIFLSTLNGGISITNAANGQFTVNMPSAQTALILPGVYLYDLWIESSVSPPIENQYIAGVLSVLESVTAVP